jgi:hypothetical protein
MKRFWLCGCATAAFCILSVGSLSSLARAGTLTESYGLTGVNFLGGGPVNSALPGFNSTLGTLTSITGTYSATAVLLVGNAISSTIKIEDPHGLLLSTITYPNMTGRVQQNESGSFTVSAADFADFLTTGNIDLTLVPATACRGTAMTPTGCSAFTALADGTVTYNFNPPAGPTTPEPASLALLSAGLVVFGVWRRKVKSGIEG